MKQEEKDAKRGNTPNGKSGRSIILGIVFGLISAGFYVTPFIFFILGIASISLITALQGELFKQYGIWFLLLGVLLAMTAILIYLRNKGVRKLAISEIRPYRAFIGILLITMSMTYAVLITLALFNFSSRP